MIKDSNDEFISLNIPDAENANQADNLSGGLNFMSSSYDFNTNNDSKSSGDNTTINFIDNGMNFDKI